jgi:hypothetical protein
MNYEIGFFHLRQIMNRQECLFYRKTLFFYFCPILESSGNSNLQKTSHPTANTDKIKPRRQARNINSYIPLLRGDKGVCPSRSTCGQHTLPEQVVDFDYGFPLSWEWQKEVASHLHVNWYPDLLFNQHLLIAFCSN